MFGREKVKPYLSQGVPMYFAVASHKQKYAVKLVTVLPEEKVCRCGSRGLSWYSAIFSSHFGHAYKMAHIGANHRT